MSPFTSEESIASDYVKNEHPDVIINIVDSTNLSRSLFFTTQLLELGIPVVVALNKINEKGYTSKEKLAGITRTKSINAKKAQKIMAEIKGKNFDELSNEIFAELQFVITGSRPCSHNCSSCHSDCGHNH